MLVDDYVIEISSGILFKIINIYDNSIYIKGVNYRIRKHVNFSEIRLATDEEVNETKKKDDLMRTSFIKNNKLSNRVISGKVLHLDGDEGYLKKCLDLYKELDVHAVGINISESDMPVHIKEYIETYKPDILVVTGHDLYNGKGLAKISNYHNSEKFIDTVDVVRNTFYKDDIVIIAGACQSHFEAIIAAGANFGSSPKRLNIHAYDPAIVAIKIATTHYTNTLNFDDVRKHLFVKKNGIGGIETKGKMRLLYKHD